MSLQDYQQGAAMGSASANAVIDEWADHANGLKRKLQNAHVQADEYEANLSKAHASRFGFAQLVRALSAELQRVDPSNSLLDRDRQLALVESHTAKKAAELGYAYDPATNTVKPVKPMIRR